MRRPHPGEEAVKPKAQYHPEGAAVDATGYGTKVARLTLGGLPLCPRSPTGQRGCATGAARRRDGAAEVRSQQRPYEPGEPTGEGPNMTCRMEARLFDGDERCRRRV